LQTQFIIQCPHCHTDDVSKYGRYKSKLITYYRCNRCTVDDQENANAEKRRRPFTFPVQQVWR
jgi:transposase-like protein